MTSNNSGSRANKTGNNLEIFVKNSLESNGYIEATQDKHLIFNNIRTMGGKQFASQIAVGKTIYGSNRKADFIVINPTKWKNGLIIECKWQESAGSVDEKYPYLVHNIIKTAIPSIVLLDGGGCRKEAMQWLKDQVNSKGTLIGVWDMAEFHKQINNDFI